MDEALIGLVEIVVTIVACSIYGVLAMGRGGGCRGLSGNIGIAEDDEPTPIREI